MSLESPQLNSIRTLIDQRADEQPDTVFLIDPVTQVSCNFSQLRALCSTLCKQVSATGVAQGSSVAYAMNNGIEAAVTILGLQYGGYRAVAINLVAGRDVMGYVLSHSETALVITQSDLVSTVNDALQSDGFMEGKNNPPLLATLTHLENDAEPRMALLWQLVEWATESTAPIFCESPVTTTQTHEVTPEQDALLMYTSGTTGRPKGVVLSHANLLAGGHNVAQGHELTLNDKALCVLPLFHINGLCVTLMGPLVSSGSVVIPPRFSTSKFWGWIEDHACTWFSVVPTQISYLLRDADQPNGMARKLPKLRFGRSASAPLSPDVHGSFEKQFTIPLIETMGLTETAAQILSNPMPPAKRKLGSPGLPVGVDLRIVNPDLVDVAANEEGELLVRGASVMHRYYLDPKATEAALTPDGWLRTGDLGRVDDEGYVFITGRLKELIIKGGENIAPREIDDALYRHPDVVEAAAFAVSCNDYGQRVEAAVSLKPGSTLAVGELLGLVQGVVGQFKCPDQIHFLEELPKGPSGKIQRNKLCDMSFS